MQVTKLLAEWAGPAVIFLVTGCLILLLLGLLATTGPR